MKIYDTGTFINWHFPKLHTASGEIPQLPVHQIQRLTAVFDVNRFLTHFIKLINLSTPVISQKAGKNEDFRPKIRSEIIIWAKDH